MKPAPQTTEGHPGNWQAPTAGTYKARRSSSSKVRASSAGPCQPALSCSEPSRAEPCPNPLRPPGPAPAPERNSRGAAPGSSRARYANLRPPIGCSARRERRFPEGAGPSGAEGRLWGTGSPGGGGDAARLRAATSAWGQPQLGVSPCSTPARDPSNTSVWKPSKPPASSSDQASENLAPLPPEVRSGFSSSA